MVVVCEQRSEVHLEPGAELDGAVRVSWITVVVLASSSHVHVAGTL